GCGNGRNYLPLVDAGLELFGLDVSPEAIKQLLQRRPTLPALRLLCDDFREFKSPLPRFDYLVAIQVFQHGADADVAAYSETAAAFLRSYLTRLPADHPHHRARVTAFAFGDSPALAKELAALVLAGHKRATASLPVQFEADGAPLPEAGDVSIVTLGDGTPVAIIETTEVRLLPFGAVDAAFAAAEGEGDRSLVWWRAAH